jgi:hypothetical protein
LDGSAAYTSAGGLMTEEDKTSVEYLMNEMTQKEWEEILESRKEQLWKSIYEMTALKGDPFIELRRLQKRLNKMRSDRLE